MQIEEGKYYRTRDGRKVGPMIECWHVLLGKWFSGFTPERKTITARVCITEDGTSLHMNPASRCSEYNGENYYAQLTFDVIDGKMDRSTARVEPLE